MPALRGRQGPARTRAALFVGAAVALVAGGVGAAVLLGPSGEGARPAAAHGPSTDAGLAGQGDAGSPSEPSEPAAPPEPQDDSTPRAEGAAVRYVRAFGDARGFRSAVEAAGASREEAVAIEQALRGVMDFRRCRPTDNLVFERRTDGTLILFEYRGGSSTEYFQASRDESGQLQGRRVEIPVQTRRIARGGVIQHSLGEAFEQLGLGRSLVGVFVEVFESKANFVLDARSGDTFRIIVDEERVGGELLRYGRVHAIEYVGQRTGTLRAFWYEPRRGEEDYFEEDGRSVAGGWLRTPCRYDRISSRFNLRRMHPILRRVVPHNGVDYAGGTGTPIRAAAAGRVTFAGERGPNGNLVSIRHENGFESFYAHLRRIARGIERGVHVGPRQVIGAMGNTGRSTGTHLHFGLKRRGRFVDPLAELNGPGRMMRPGARGPFRAHVRRMRVELDRIDVRGGQGAEGRLRSRGQEPMD